MNGEPMYNAPYVLEPFTGVKAKTIDMTTAAGSLYSFPFNFAFVLLNQSATALADNAILLPTLQANYDTQSQVAFIWWKINSAFDGQEVSLKWDYPRASTSVYYPYAAETLNGDYADFTITRSATDTRNHLFFILVGTPNQGYYIRAVNDGSIITSITSANAKLTVAQVGQAFTLTNNVSVTAGTGIAVTGSPIYSISAYAGVPVQLGNIVLANQATQYFGLNGVASATADTSASVIAFIASQPGSISSLYVNLAANVTATSHTYTLRNASSYAALADSTITCAMVTGAHSASDTTHSINVVAGDLITIKLVQAGTPESSAVKASISFLFKPSAV